MATKKSPRKPQDPTGSTTIRVDRDTHGRLMKISADTGTSIVDLVRESVRAYEHRLFADRLVAQLEAMRQDPDEWESYVEECEMFGGYGRGTINVDA